MSSYFSYFPYVRPSAILLGSAFNYAADFMVYGPLMGNTWAKVMRNEEEFECCKGSLKKQATCSFLSKSVGTLIQAYSIGALLQLTGTVSYKGAFYLGLYVYGATAVHDMVDFLFLEKRSMAYAAIKSIAAFIKTVGLPVLLLGYGVRRV
ncbi:DUF1761 family protein [Schizosaccharomyces japonicus yFS275]|uniref:DUF1761 family protein n=1 Tax=Schizosaccharomyces japonicus (strain yFS275 / FY16936) TaxID=402676 RepID=B6K7B7_SCHJY|nr:DUF1761 family protein [Schizosaccharomyces japonicus yFS275]EEB09421.1 DUF1761 family protein [Schizosaccharomyces japonicus yFS275]